MNSAEHIKEAKELAEDGCMKAAAIHLLIVIAESLEIIANQETKGEDNERAEIHDPE